MLIVRPNNYVAGTVIRSAEVNDDFDTIYIDYNGNIDDDNIAAGAGITVDKLAQGTFPVGTYDMTGSTLITDNSTIDNSAIDGATITNSDIDSSPIGATTPDTGAFTTISATSTLLIGGISTFSNDIKLALNKKLYLDGGTDTFFTHDGTYLYTYLNSTTLPQSILASYGLELYRYSDTATSATQLELIHYRTGGAISQDGDSCGRVYGSFKDSDGSKVGSGYIEFVVDDVTAGTTDGSVKIVNRRAGTYTEDARFTNKQMLLPNVDPPTANYMNRNSGVKAWLKCDFGNVSISGDYNITSITSSGVITWDTNFANTHYVVSSHTNYSAALIVASVAIVTAQATGTCTIKAGSGGNFSNGITQFIIAIGDQ